MQERGCQLPQYCHQIHIYCYGFSYYMSCQPVKTQHQKGLGYRLYYEAMLDFANILVQTDQ